MEKFFEEWRKLDEGVLTRSMCDVCYGEFPDEDMRFDPVVPALTFVLIFMVVFPFFEKLSLIATGCRLPIQAKTDDRDCADIRRESDESG